jgi:signal transduction histidine kinase
MYQLLRASLKTEADRTLVDSFRSWGAFPVVVGGEAIGAVSVASTDWDFFSEWRRYLLRLFADKAALIAAFEDATIAAAKKAKEQADEIRRGSLEMNQIYARTGYSEAARTTVHNLAALFQRLERSVSVLERWRKKRADVRFPDQADQALESLQVALGQIEEAFEFYQRIRSGAPVRSRIAVADLLGNAIAFCGLKAEKLGVRIELREGPTGMSILGSEPELLQAFVNIIVNAIEAMAEPGAPGKHLIVRWFGPDNATVVFEDQGIGIKNRNLRKVFEPDYTTKGDKGGTGLGLPHARRAVKAAGGTISISSTYRRGTTVKVVLPLAAK